MEFNINNELGRAICCWGSRHNPRTTVSQSKNIYIMCTDLLSGENWLCSIERSRLPQNTIKSVRPRKIPLKDTNVTESTLLLDLASNSVILDKNTLKQGKKHAYRNTLRASPPAPDAVAWRCAVRRLGRPAPAGPGEAATGPALLGWPASAERQRSLRRRRARCRRRWRSGRATGPNYSGGSAG